MAEIADLIATTLTREKIEGAKALAEGLGEGGEINFTSPTSPGRAFTGRYKVGPIHKSLNFYAFDLKDARLKFSRFVQFFKGTENHKVVPIGQVEPMIVDIDEEIVRISKQCSNATSMPI